jgi:Trk K+ transport system NAD-binding subunit
VNKPIILCGLGLVGWRVLEYLQAAGLPVIAIDNHCSPGDPRLGNARLIVGDCRRRETLEQAGIRECGGLLVVTSDDQVNVSTALMARALNADVRLVVRVFNENLIERLGHGVKNIFPLSTSALAAPQLAIRALTGQAIGTFRAGGQGAPRHQVNELTIPPGSLLCARTIKEIIRRYRVFVLLHVPVGGAPRLLTEVDLRARLQAGDQLGVCGEPADVRALLTQGEEESDAELRWAGFLRRIARTFWRTFHEVDLAVKVCTITLLTVILVSTLFFMAMLTWSAPAALYRTVSVMATMADMRTNADPDELKVFVSVLRLVGAALTAAFTAIVTNYLVRASLGGALEVRRIPDGGHVLVCGIGAIGYRVVDELIREEERVVAIEMSRDNRFVSTVRRQGVPVIIGDATIHEVMRQAHAATARAVIACTSSDMINLEIALLTRELNPNGRVVVLQSEPQLAELLRNAANVRLAVSVPSLAAPAFLAGLFGDRVLSVFRLHNELLAVIDLLIGPQDTHLVGQSGRTVAIDHGLLPVAMIPFDGSPPPRDPFFAHLDSGDRLVAIVPLKDLERLLRRQAAPAEWTVEVTGFERKAREWLALYVQKSRQAHGEEAPDGLDELPFCLERGLTRGQALDRVNLLEREYVSARMYRERS